MSNNTGLLVLVTETEKYNGFARVNVYKPDGDRPMLTKIELPFASFPHEPQIGEQFTLVIA